MRVGTTLHVALTCALLTAPTATALASGASEHTAACFESAGGLLDGPAAEAVCAVATPHVAECIGVAWDHGVRGQALVVACHEAEAATADCVADAWLAGHRGREVALACHHRDRRLSAVPGGNVYLAPTRGTETAELSACDGHVDVTRDALGRLEVNFSLVERCAAFEIFDAAGIRRFTPELKIGTGALRRTGSWTVPSRIVNVAGAGLALVMLGADGARRTTVYVDLGETR